MIIERKRRRRLPRTAPQDILREAVIAYLTQALPPTAFFGLFPLGDATFFHGLSLRSAGVRRGFPSLLILYQGRAYCIDLKAERRPLQLSQRDCYAALQDARVPITVARSLEDVQRFLCEDCALPMRNWRSAA